MIVIRRPLEPNGRGGVRNTSFSFFLEPVEISAHSYASIVGSLRQKRECNGPTWEPFKGFHLDAMSPQVRSAFQVDELPPVTAWSLSDEARSRLLLDREWTLRFDLGARDIAFRFGDDPFAVLLVLFEPGCALFVVNVAPTSHAVADWLDFMSAFSNGDPIRGSELIAPSGESSPTTPDWAGASLRVPELLHHFFMETGAAPEDCQSFKPAFFLDRLIPFFALYFDNTVLSQHQAEVLYRLRHHLSSSRRLPDNFERRHLHDETDLVPGGTGYVLCARSHGGLVCFGSDEISKPDMEPDYLWQEFLPLHLFALAQRCCIASISERMTGQWLPTRRQSLGVQQKAFEKIREDMLHFRARLYFSHASHRQMPTQYYRRLQSALEVDRMFAEVQSAVAEMHDYLNAKRTERFQKRINVIATAFLIPSLLFSFLGINFAGVTSNGGGIELGGIGQREFLVGLGILTLTIMGALFLFLRRD